MVVMPVFAVGGLGHKHRGIRLRPLTVVPVTIRCGVSAILVVAVIMLSVMRLTGTRLVRGFVVMPVVLVFGHAYVGSVVMFVLLITPLCLRRGMMMAVALMRWAGDEGANIRFCSGCVMGEVWTHGRSNVEVQSLLLLRHQIRVESASNDQFLVFAGLHQPPAVQHQDAVSIDHA